MVSPGVGKSRMKRVYSNEGRQDLPWEAQAPDDNVGSVVKPGEPGKGKAGVRLGWSWWGGGSIPD